MHRQADAPNFLLVQNVGCPLSYVMHKLKPLEDFLHIFKECI